ncbi:unnamed protein product [Lactuca virosa]|uniref:HAT C-terminal dimerisation domain-containing protein n=1 Tax=Lactuca virosa TaxID=75947 RepID=A0AAU9NCZ9_9ASTR|nr:unnamed protein product [Lactuca virosa]
MNGLYATIQRLVPDLSTQDKIGEQLDLYQNAHGLFGNPMAIRQRDKRAPADWWSAYGAYQRKDTTDPILLKEIDESNEWLMGHMDEENVEEDDFVFDGNDLTWSVVDKASGASEPNYSTRRSSTPSSTSLRDKGNGVAETSNCKRASRGFSLIDEEIEEDNGVSEDDGEE